jgi:hypothetical protein
MATELTTTSTDISGDFFISVSGLSSVSVNLMMAAGSGGTDFHLCETFNENRMYWVKNSNQDGALTNAFKKSASVGTLRFSQ